MVHTRCFPETMFYLYIGEDILSRDRVCSSFKIVRGYDKREDSFIKMQIPRIRHNFTIVILNKEEKISFLTTKLYKYCKSRSNIFVRLTTDALNSGSGGTMILVILSRCIRDL